MEYTNLTDPSAIKEELSGSGFPQQMDIENIEEPPISPMKNARITTNNFNPLKSKLLRNHKPSG